MPDMAVTIRTAQGEALNPASTGAQIALTAQNGVEKANVQEALEALHARIARIEATLAALDAAAENAAADDGA